MKNKVEEPDLVDDFIYLTIKMDREIMQKQDKNKKTPMLLKLPNQLEYQDAVLIVQDDDQKKKWLEYVQDLNTGFGS